MVTKVVCDFNAGFQKKLFFGCLVAATSDVSLSLTSEG